MVAFWPAHEQGIMEGSTWFVDNDWDRLDEGALLYLNCDEMGKRGTTVMRASCSPEALPLAHLAAKDGLGLTSLPTRDLVKMGDQSFFGIGIPSLWLQSSPDAETTKAWQGADFGWWWHTKSDTMDKLDPDVLQRELRVSGAALWHLSRDAVLPFRFEPVARRIEARLGEIGRSAGGNLDVSAPSRLAREFASLARALDRASDAGRDTNALQQRLSRLLTSATLSVAGRWAQDSYGLSDLATYLPGLRDAQALPSLKGTDGYYLIENRLLRERNRLRDALREACRACEGSTLG